jgi:transposase
VKEQTYLTNLTDSQWNHLKELVPGAKPGGRRRTVEVREVINALLYVDNNGIKWRALPVMTRKANASCLQTISKLYFWERGTRYYEVHLHQDLWGDWVLTQVWGRRGTELGRMVHTPCASYEKGHE